jgi:hypothetical protein
VERSDYQQRVIDEKRELDEKLDRLEKFMESVTCEGLCFSERMRLNNQRLYMRAYSRTLGERIEAFKP